jgi:hypothetical protein
MSIQAYKKQDFAECVQLAYDYYNWVGNGEADEYEELGWLIESLKGLKKSSTTNCYLYRNTRGDLAGLILGTVHGRAFEIDYLLINPYVVTLSEESSPCCKELSHMIEILKAMVDKVEVFDHIFNCVPEEDLAMLNILKERGFIATNLSYDYYIMADNRRCDGIVMQYWNQSLLPFDVTYSEKQQAEASL